jgi:hypothetical protein
MTQKYSVAVLLPTRGRTEALNKSVFSIVDTANDYSKIQILLAFDADDTTGIEHFDNQLRRELEIRKVNFKALKFNRLGYINLHKYYNELANHASADWLFVWNDDAFMTSSGWDQNVAEHTGQFKILKVRTHRDHPYSIFPIVPVAWPNLLGHLSGHHMIDAWISQIGYLMDIIEIVDINVTHDRHDLTGNNADETFVGSRVSLEGNPRNPADFHNPAVNARRMIECEKIAEYLKSNGLSVDWWNQVKLGQQDPWEKLKANDVNQQMVQFAPPKI